jgi:hypothetical protein
MRDWCIWLVDLFECMMMHGLANPKFTSCMFQILAVPGGTRWVLCSWGREDRTALICCSQSDSRVPEATLFRLQIKKNIKKKKNWGTNRSLRHQPASDQTKVAQKRFILKKITSLKVPLFRDMTKRRELLAPHGVTSQENWIFSNIAASTSNLTTVDLALDWWLLDGW